MRTVGLDLHWRRSSRILASSSTGRREKRRRSRWSSAILALIVTKPSPTAANGAARRMRDRSGRSSPISPVPRQALGQRSWGRLSRSPMFGVCVGKSPSLPEGENIDQPNNMPSSAKFEDRGIQRNGSASLLVSLVDSARRLPLDHSAVEKDAGRHCLLPFFKRLKARPAIS